MKRKFQIPSSAIAFVGRHNSGKTTLIEGVIDVISMRGYDVGSIKHHSHADFEIDIPGKDSYRHFAAGATDTIIASPSKMARVKRLGSEIECDELVESMPNHDIVIVEGYRNSGLPTIEVMRADNEADVVAAGEFVKCVADGVYNDAKVVISGDTSHMPDQSTVAIVTDIDTVKAAAECAKIPTFEFGDYTHICDFLVKEYVRKSVCLVIQAGGKSTRMGYPKEQLEVGGAPNIVSLINRFSPYVDEVVITSNEPSNLDFLDDYDFAHEIKITPDFVDCNSPLSGMYTAFSYPESDIVALIACDMIFASEKLLASQISIMQKKKCDVCIPRNKHGREPFHALYNRQKCLKSLESALEHSENRVQSFLDYGDLDIYEMTPTQIRDIVPRGGCFININTPDELKKFTEK